MDGCRWTGMDGRLWTDGRGWTSVASTQIKGTVGGKPIVARLVRRVDWMWAGCGCGRLPCSEAGAFAAATGWRTSRQFAAVVASDGSAEARELWPRRSATLT